jgi:glycosyltransferase involved in cell wall biosynthesis
MRIGLLIGGLGQGGAERQLVQLALGLHQRGHEVEVMTYAAAGPAGNELQLRGVSVRSPGADCKWAKWGAVRDWLRIFRPEVVHGSMKRASSLAVMANLPDRRSRVVGTDMSTASYSRHKPELWLALALFTFADAVVTQTEMNRRNLARLAPWLARRLHVIRNGVDTERFRPAERPFEEQGSVREASSAASKKQKVFRFVCVGTVYRVKNPVRVVEAVHRLHQRWPGAFRLDWYGRPGQNPGEPSADYLRAAQLVEQYGLQDCVRFHGPRADIEGAYREADALVHVSLQEGIPNAVVEGMACGLPIVVSRVSDLPLIVETARNGFVCDETDVEAIADAMLRILETAPTERAAMGRRSRELAVNWFGLERYISEFEALYRSLLARP